MHWEGYSGEECIHYYARGRTLIGLRYDNRGAIHTAHKTNRDNKQSTTVLRRHIPYKVNRVIEWLTLQGRNPYGF